MAVKLSALNAARPLVPGRFLVLICVIGWVYPRTIVQQWSICHIAPFLRFFVPNSLQANRHFFFSEECACNVCDWSLLAPEWALCFGHSVALFSGPLDTSWLLLQVQEFGPAWDLPAPRLCGSGDTPLCRVLVKGHWHSCVSGLGGVGSEVLHLQTLNSLCGLHSR
jgi:hypothetical protein